MCVCSFSRVDALVYLCACVCLCAVSEPTLKWKIKKLISTRPNPLQRKISAPPTVRHRTETLGRLSTLKPSVHIILDGFVNFLMHCRHTEFCRTRLIFVTQTPPPPTAAVPQHQGAAPPMTASIQTAAHWLMRSAPL